MWQRLTAFCQQHVMSAFSWTRPVVDWKQLTSSFSYVQQGVGMLTTLLFNVDLTAAD